MRYILAGAAVVLAIFAILVLNQDIKPASTDDDIPTVAAPTEPYKVRSESWKPGDTE